MDYIKYITDGIESICKNHKRRSAGYESVKTAQAQMAEEMKDYVDEIRTQQFDIHPRAFIGSIPLDALLCLIACGFFVAGVFLKMFSLLLRYRTLSPPFKTMPSVIVNV